VLGLGQYVGGRTGGIGFVVHDEQAVVRVDDEVDESLDDAAVEFGDDGDLLPVPACDGELDDRRGECGLDP
jgi:hypothetical protein